MATLTVVATGLLMINRSPPPPLSLVFERYSTRRDFFVQDVTFLQLSNSSDKTYYLPMVGGTNTLLPDAPLSIARHKEHRQIRESYLVTFVDNKNAKVWGPVATWGRCAVLPPRSTIRIRVPLPPAGERRKVAVVCAEMPKGPREFWTKGVGLTILRIVPRSWGRRLLWSDPKVQQVWCDRELSHPDAITPKEVTP